MTPEMARARWSTSARSRRCSFSRSGLRLQSHLATHARSADAAIALRILRQVLLVFVLGVMERRRRIHDLGGDRAETRVRQSLLVGIAARDRGVVLLPGVAIDRGPILGAGVVALAHALGRIVAF